MTLTPGQSAKVAKKLRRPRRGLTLSPWRLGYHAGYSERGGECGREWSRHWIMQFNHSNYFRRGVVLGPAGIVRLNGDGLEVRGWAFGMDGSPPVLLRWSNGNGVDLARWPHPAGWRWACRRYTEAEFMAALEREMGRQRAEIDRMLYKAMRRAGWAT